MRHEAPKLKIGDYLLLHEETEGVLDGKAWPVTIPAGAVGRLEAGYAGLLLLEIHHSRPADGSSVWIQTEGLRRVSFSKITPLEALARQAD